MQHWLRTLFCFNNMETLSFVRHSAQAALQGLSRSLLCSRSRRSNSTEREMLLRLFEKYALPAIAFVLGNDAGAESGACLRQALPATDLNMVQQLCELLALQLHESGGVRRAEAGPHDFDKLCCAVECRFTIVIHRLSLLARLA